MRGTDEMLRKMIEDAGLPPRGAFKIPRDVILRDEMRRKGWDVDKVMRSQSSSLDSVVAKAYYEPGAIDRYIGFLCRPPNWYERLIYGLPGYRLRRKRDASASYSFYMGRASE